MLSSFVYFVMFFIAILIRKCRGQSQGLLELQAWVIMGFFKRAADFYEWFIHKMCILNTEILKKYFNYQRKWMN